MNKKFAFLGFALAISALTVLFNKINYSEQSSNVRFVQWKNDFNVKFQNDFEDLYRRTIFYQNLLQIDEHNANPHKTFTMAVNQFTALTKQQFIHCYLGIIPQLSLIQKLQSKPIATNPINNQIDWTLKDAVSPVKNQGQCGSCWAFSCTGALEGLCKITTGTLKVFSQQQLVDCSGSYGTMGCNGGTMINGFNYVKAKGICEQQFYPYRATKQSCKNCTSSFFISGYSKVEGCIQLSNALSSTPISAIVDASNWQSYSSGIFNKCQSNLNHGVLVVGTSSGWWKIKNSWGNAWGEKGFIRIAGGNTCGVCKAGVYPFK